MRLTLAAVCGLAAAVCLSGCSSLIHFAAPTSVATAPAEGQAAPPPATVQVVLKNTRGKIKQSTLPLTEGMSVQTALEKTGAIRKYTDMEIKVYRVTPFSKGVAVPLQAEYDPSKNCVPVLNDMALHPGDKILVEENDTSQFELMLSRLTGNAAKRRGLD